MGEDPTPSMVETMSIPLVTFACKCIIMFIVDVSMVVICYASGIIEYERRTSELSNAPLLNIQDTHSIDR